jgi:hypothetical protein
MRSTPPPFLLLPAAAVLLFVACSESRSPTEPSAVPATPAATSTPTPAPGLPANLSGTVRSYGPLEPGTTVECQGASTTISSDGSYALSGLHSGPATATVTYTYVTKSGETVTETLTASLVLDPGSNTRDFLVY